FTGLNTSKKARLFQSDGTSITLAPGDIGADPAGLTNVNGNLFFQASDAAHGNELHILASSEPPPPTPFSISLSTKQNGKVTHTINEGESLHFTFNIEGDVAIKLEWDWQDGTFTKGGNIRDHTFRNNLPKDATRLVRLKVTTANHGIKNLFSEVTVLNVAPVIKKFALPNETVPFLNFPASFVVDDAGADDKLTVTINWGDGTSDSKVLSA